MGTISSKATLIRQVLEEKGNIIWFNPPFNCTTKFRVKWLFINFIDKHFPKEHS